jgi:glycosyltransferase involved in cell wall biosynthesis
VPAVAANFIRVAAAAGVAPVVYFAYDGIYADDLRAAGIPVRTLGPRTPLLWRLKRFMLNLVLLFQGKQYDLVHIHSNQLVWSVLFAKLLGLRVVFQIHELPRRFGWPLRLAMAKADAVVFCSETCAAHYAAVPARRKVTIVNALDFPEGTPVNHLPENRRIVVTASLNRHKGQDLVLEAFARLPYPDAELYLYGTTGLSAKGFVRRLKRRAIELGVAERVYFPGPTADVWTVFRSAAVVVHASWTESFGMALVEAQSCGVPVIAHQLEGMLEVVTDGETGFLVPPGDVPALTDRMQRLLAEPALRNRLGAAGYARMRERFSVAARLDDYRALYAGVCRQ